MKDLIEALQFWAAVLPSQGAWIERNGSTIPNNVCSQAADEIDRLRGVVAECHREIYTRDAEIGRLRSLLAECWHAWTGTGPPIILDRIADAAGLDAAMKVKP